MASVDQLCFSELSAVASVDQSHERLFALAGEGGRPPTLVLM